MTRKLVIGVNAAGRRVGESHPRAKLSQHEVDLILALRDEGLSYRTIAVKFEISASHAYDICSGRRWGHVIVRWKRRG